MTTLLGLSIIAIILTLIPHTQSCHWGPGIHIELASRLLAEKDRLPTKQAELLAQQEDHFLYGCIAADIINLKKFGGLDNHCHNWNIEQRLAPHVDTDAERAFVLGYLCHLAADVVAHNHFVPYHIVFDLPPYVLGHTYWEARADSFVAEPIWLAIDKLRNHTSLHNHDRLVKEAVPIKLLSMGPNKFIFNHVLLMRSKQKWRDIMEKVKRQNPAGAIQQPFLDRCRDYCYENMLAVFSHQRFANLQQLDASGHQALADSRKLARRLIDSHGNMGEAREAAQAAAERLFGSSSFVRV